MLFSERPPIYVSSCMTISGEKTEQHVIGFGESIRIRQLEYVDIHLVY